MLIVEGPDGAGKTTLIQKLVEAFGIPVAPRVVSKDAKAMIDLRQWVEGNVATAPHNMIYDRHRLISEPIYGPILRGGSQEEGFTEPTWMQLVTQAFYFSHPLIVYCLPPLDVVKTNVVDDEDNEVVWEHIDAVYTAYVARAAIDLSLSPRSTLIYDYTRDSMSIFDPWVPILTHRKEMCR